MNHRNTLRYEQPASDWLEALPLGNGHLGAMHFGGIHEDRVGLNEGTFWAGGPHDYAHEGAVDVLDQIRQLIFAGQTRKAAELADSRFMSVPLRQQPFLPIGDLRIETAFEEPVADYQRVLDLDQAESRVSFTHQGNLITRQVFANHPHNVLIYRLSSSGSALPATTVRVGGELGEEWEAVGPRMYFFGRGKDSEGIAGQVRFVLAAEVIAPGAEIAQSTEGITISGAETITVVLSIATNHVNYRDLSGDPRARVDRAVDAAVAFGVEELEREHRSDHQQLFRSTEFELGPDRSHNPVAQRIASFHAGSDPDLAALYAQYGRYLLIACSRPGGQPANLQGIWNKDVSPAWGSKYTVNINTEMNYWLAEKCGLSECHDPLFDLLADVAVTGRRGAEVHYGAKRGWVLHHNTDLWRGAAPIDGASWGVWPMGGAWLCTHLWERYLYTGDQDGLSEHYPLMKGAAEFFLETLVKDPITGHLVTCPAVSPENETPIGTSLCPAPTMDVAILRDLFSAVAEASEILALDEALRDEIKSAAAQLPPFRIGKAGQLQEWQADWDVEAPEPHHRHVSHLYALHPSHQIGVSTPELMDAARQTLAMRGDDGTGWSLAWKMNFWARLRDGNHALELAKIALRPVPINPSEAINYGGAGGVYPNLFDAHPPFQIDGNFGFTNGLIEMLIHSDGRAVTLLPALPDAWLNGRVSGIRTIGGGVYAFRWEAGQVVEASLTLGWRGEAATIVKGTTIASKGTPGAIVKLV